MEGSGSIALEIIVIAILIAVNGFFSMIEMAVVSANKNRINSLAEEGDTRAKTVIKLMGEPSSFLSTIQVGITLAGMFTAGQATQVFSQRLRPVFERLGLNPQTAQTASFIAITLIISYFTLVFGELIPKRAALQNTEAIALKGAKPINTLSKIARPFVKLLSGSTVLFGKMFGIHSETIEEEISIEEIRSMIEVGKEKGVINQTERDMLDGIFKFDNKLAREVMTPRPDVSMIDISEDPEKIIKEITYGRYSRLPVYEGEPDNIIGILVLKDLYRELISQGKVTDLRKILREVLFIPETKHIDDLFREMQNSSSHFAVLIDEYGGFSGIVTIEDLLEEIVGNIFDEHDVSFKEINRIGPDTYVVDALVTIDQLNDDLFLDLNNENADTIGGYFIEKLGRVPRAGDYLDDEEISMEVLRVRGKRIKDMKIVKKPEVIISSSEEEYL